MDENLPDTNVGNIEYIRKQDALDAFSRIKNTLKNPETAHYDTLMFYEIEDVLEDVEPADVVPVVRCKDCKFYTSMRPDIKTGICDLNVHHMGDDGFCSCGERREE